MTTHTAKYSAEYAGWETEQYSQVFRESEHPRQPAGSSVGGQFAPWQSEGFASRDEWVKARMRKSLKAMGVHSASSPQAPVMSKHNIDGMAIGNPPVPKRMRADSSAIEEWFGEQIRGLASQGHSASQIAKHLMSDADASLVLKDQDVDAFDSALDAFYDKLHSQHKVPSTAYMTIDGANWEDHQSEYRSNILGVYAESGLRDAIESMMQSPEDRYSAIQRQCAAEIERYTKHLDWQSPEPIDPDRYGMGGNILRLILAALAAHALSADDTEPQESSGGQQTAQVSNQPFEQLHPREQTTAGQKRAGQFAPKPKPAESSADDGAAPKEFHQWADTANWQSQPPLAKPQPKPLDHLTQAVAEKWHGNTKDSSTNDSHGSGNGDMGVSAQASADPVPASMDGGTEPEGLAMAESSVEPAAGPSDTPEPTPEPTSAPDNGDDRELDDSFDPAALEQSIPEQPEAAGKPLKKSDVATKFDGDFDAFDQAKKDRAALVRENRKWEREVEENPDRNIDEIAAEYEMDPAELRAHAESLQNWEQDEWTRREQVKTQIRKAWGVHGGTLRDMENKGLDHNSLQNSDGLYGSLDTGLLHEYLGPDEHSWAEKAWSLLREDPQPKPGMHDKNWLRKVAEEAYNKQMAGIAASDDPYFYDPGEDEFGNKMPFSRKSLGLLVDRYFRIHREKYRARNAHSSGDLWTSIDHWL